MEIIDLGNGAECKIFTNGSKYWYLNGKYHRVGGPAVEDANGNKFWYINDKLHRTDGPAIEYANGDKSWHINDMCHRLDGPAKDWHGMKQWWVNGIQYSKEYFTIIMQCPWII